MQPARAVRDLRQPLRAAVGSSSRRSIRHPSIDRYLLIRDFFTRQAAKPLPSARTRIVPLRFSSSASNDPHPRHCPDCPPSAPSAGSSSSLATPASSSTPPPPPTPSSSLGHAQDYTPFIQRLIQQSTLLKPGSPHRPTKEQLLEAAGSWWQRLRIRIKWFTIRGWRRFNADDLSAFASWFVVGNTLWILIGTTTFVSAIFATLNSLSLQEYVARWISDYMTSETGVTVIFESAIVPKWGASTITFRNVFISRRPATADGGSPAQSRAATATPPSPTPFLSSSLSPDTFFTPPAGETDNYTMFDVNLDEVEVTLSFMRWLDGKGLVKDAKIKGVRGVVDRRSVWWDMSKPIVPAEWRHQTQPGDFEFESFQVEDALITIYQPGGQRPYNVSVFNASIGPLRKRWLFYDMMSAEGITGQFDNCLFSLHMPQKLGKAVAQDDQARFRIDGLPIEHAQYATGHTGPISWITSGKLDAVLDIKFPFHPDEQVDIKAIFEEIGRNVATISHGVHPDQPDAVTHTLPSSDPLTDPLNRAIESAAAAEAARSSVIPGQARLARPPLRAPTSGPVDVSAKMEEELELEGKRQVTVDIDLRFRDLKAAVPMFTSDLSYRNNALIRPIVAFINANRTLVPIHCQVAADLSDFDGSWTLFETGLMSSIADQIFDALAHHVSSEAANSKRLRQVSVWGIQRGAEVLLDTLRNVVDPVHAQLAPTPV